MCIDRYRNKGGGGGGDGDGDGDREGIGSHDYVTEPGKSQGLWGELASWRLRRANSVVPVKGCQAPGPERADDSVQNYKWDKTKTPAQRPSGRKNSLLLGGGSAF